MRKESNGNNDSRVSWVENVPIMPIKHLVFFSRKKKITKMTRKKTVGQNAHTITKHKTINTR